jgi:hypothetical protein
MKAPSFLKTYFLPGLILALTSCEQKSTDSSAALKDSTLSNTTDSIEKPEEAAIKHFAFKSDITDLPQSLSKFVPDGYIGLDTVSGDLNLDQYSDMILVLKKKEEEYKSDEKRPLLILIADSLGAYELAGKNDNVVYCITCGGAMGDPFMSVVVKKGFFSVEHYGGGGPTKWQTITTFRYLPEDKKWYLHKEGLETYEMNPSDKPDAEVFIKGKEVVKTKKDFGKVLFEEYDIYKED